MIPMKRYYMYLNKDIPIVDREQLKECLREIFVGVEPLIINYGGTLFIDRLSWSGQNVELILPEFLSDIQTLKNTLF